jgi:transcriptional regulator with XRE-family HTH domain
MAKRFKPDLLRELVKKAQSGTGMTKVEVLKQIDITDGTYYNLLANGMTPTIDTLDKLSCYFGLKWQDFFEDDEPPTGLLPPALHDTPPPATSRRGRKPAMAGEGQMALLAQEVQELREQLSQVVRHISLKVKVYMFGGLGGGPNACTPSWAG